MQMNPSQLDTFLTAAIKAKISVLVIGPPGVAKTAIAKQVSQSLDHKVIVTRPSIEDPTVPMGMPWIQAGDTEAKFVPFGHLAGAVREKVPTVWIADDLGQGTPAMQAAYMPLMDRTLPGGDLDHVVFIGTSNRRGDRAGVAGLLEPVKSRFCVIVELVPDVDSWCNGYAIPAGLPVTGIAFLRFRPDLLSDFKPTADLTNSTSPRTWDHCFSLEALNLPPAIEASAMQGAVGPAALEYIAFRRMYQSLTSVDAILLDPSGCKLPTQPSELYATCTALASKANAQNLSRIGTYAQRLVDASRAEFAVLLMRDCIRRDPKLQFTDSFVRISSGPLGQLISGMDAN